MAPLFQPIGDPFIELQTVDSTNNYATALLHEGMAQHGTVVFSHNQTAGKGQRNKSWLTGNGLNIALTAIVNPSGLLLSQLFLLSMASAMAVHDLFSRYAGAGAKVKWPNDLFWGDRKAAGILIENGISGTEWKYAIIGIGININQEVLPALEASAISLKNITGEHYNIVGLAKELCADLDKNYQQLFADPLEIAKAYQKQLYKLNERVRLKKGSRQFETTIKGVTPAGQLVTYHGIEEQFSVGEVEWLTVR